MSLVRDLRPTPLLAALLAAFMGLSPLSIMAADSAAVASAPPTADNVSLPELTPPTPSTVRLRPVANGVGLDSNDAASRLSVNTETSQRVGLSVGLRGALTLSDVAALGGGLRLGGNGSEVFVNLGISLDNAQRLMLTGGQLRQKLEFAFPSGASRAEMTQNSAGAVWRLKLGSGLFDYAEATAYTARTASRDLGAVIYAADTATLYELWRDPRRIAGSTLDGLQGKLGLRPWDGGRASVGFGQERLRYGLLNGTERHNRATGSLGLEQALDSRTRIRFGADAAAAQSRTTLGVDHRIGDLGTLGVDIVNIRGRDGTLNDNRVEVSWTIPLGKAGTAALPAGLTGMSAGSGAAQAADGSRMPEGRPGSGNDGLLDQVAARPAWMPAQVVAKLDTTAGPTRLVAVDKTALPAGSSVAPATGIVTAPLGVAVLGIAAVTRNGVPFVNAGQFALSGNNLVVNPNLIAQPAVGVVDIYVVAVDNAGGGMTLVTVNVSHGSVKIDSIALLAFPAGYVYQGGLTWTPVLAIPPAIWNDANAYCTGTTINGQTGWRLPTTTELSVLYDSEAMRILTYAWSSTSQSAGTHDAFSLIDGSFSSEGNMNAFNVTCVR
jgi:hypothetical protein